MKNLITDVPGVLVGNAEDRRAATGVTVAMFERSVAAGVITLSGAPGSRAVTLLEPEMGGLADAIVLSGGSIYGLDAAGGVTAVLRAQGKGAEFGGIAIPVATDAQLTKAECKRLAIMANDGLSKALRPVHAPNDGDTVFAAAMGTAGPGGDPSVLTELGTVAADCLARAVARGVYEATALPYKDALPDWKTRFGGARA